MKLSGDISGAFKKEKIYIYKETNMKINLMTVYLE